MSKDALNDDLPLSAAAREKYQELVALLACEKYGPAGPPLATTFAEIEQFGHRVGRMVARDVDAQLTEQHSQQFDAEQACPACRSPCAGSEERKRRSLQTVDGDVPLREPTFHCPVCDRDFFPSAYCAVHRWRFL